MNEGVATGIPKNDSAQSPDMSSSKPANSSELAPTSLSAPAPEKVNILAIPVADLPKQDMSAGIELPALKMYLRPLQLIFEGPKINEISINKPGEVWVEEAGDIKKVLTPDLTLRHLETLAQLVAQSTAQIITSEKPVLSATLPNGFRIQIIIPPACENGKVIMSIRKPSVMQYTLDDYEKFGAFSEVLSNYKLKNDDSLKELTDLLKQNRIKDFIKMAILSKKNIIISGGTSTGKTTFTNSILGEIPPTERLITAEDAREINLSRHENKVHLLASKGGQGLSSVTIQTLIEACLRLRPDRIIVGELRGPEAFSFLRAINTGHPGSISTLHADTPKMAIEQLKMMVLQAGLGLRDEQIREYVLNVVDVIIQLKRGDHGRRFVSEILLTKDLAV